MSSSDSSNRQPLHCLHVEAPEIGLGVLVIDAHGSIVGRCREEQHVLELELPRGLYTIRSHRCGNFCEQPIRLNGPLTINAPGPGVFSAAPIPGATTTHEYYTYPAWESSTRPTAPAQEWNGPAQSDLLLFARAIEASQYRGEEQFAALSLRTLDGRTLSRFEEESIRRDQMGWSAFSAHLSPGLLILEDSGEEPRQIPVPLLPGWQTQFFAIHRGQLLWEDMRIHLVSARDLHARANANRNPYDFQSEDLRTAPNMDLGLLALQNDAPSVWPQLIEPFLQSEEKNPLLGLLGAYLMVLQYSRSLLGSDRGPAPPAEQVAEVLDQLHRLMPDSADLVALRLLAQDLVPGELLQAPVAALPWFRLGAETLLREHDQAPHRGLLPREALLLTVRHRLHGDCVLTTWEPINLPPPDEDLSMSLAPEAIQLRPDDLERDGIPGLDPGLVLSIDRTVMARTDGDAPRWMHTHAAPPKIKERPGFSLAYERLLEVMADFSSPGASAPSTETLLTEFIPPDDKDGLFWLSRRIARRFRDFDVELSESELATAVTLSDVTQLIIGEDA